ncbi:MAG: hypothetical protein EXR76_16895 [Myxococcales bacterium]|nr:hypothetical protein [Myxococcales bacterium]
MPRPRPTRSSPRASRRRSPRRRRARPRIPTRPWPRRSRRAARRFRPCSISCRRTWATARPS